MDYWLLDTGPIVAYLDARDAEHHRVASAFESHTGRLVTTSAVVVEAMHFLGNVPSGAPLLVEFLQASQTDIHECTSIEQLVEAAELMAQYADTPMDFADASLVLLGERLKIHAVCTLDFRGFRTYRIRRRKAFRLVLADVA
jgi:predicted nucleic acid-binding protein